MNEFAWPIELAATVAPLPLPLAEHLYRYYLRKYTLPFSDVRTKLIRDIADKRKYVFSYMHSYVQNRNKPAPYELRFTSQWVRETLGMYTPDQEPVNEKTLTHWIKVGFLRMESKGRPDPDSAAALCILRMLIEGHKLLPDRMDPRETWYCFAQVTPDQPITHVPLSSIAQLPPATLVWTVWTGANWQDWRRVGVTDGAISFAGMRPAFPYQYNISIEDIVRWCPHLESQYNPRPGREDDEVQGLAHLALVQLARERL